MALISIVLLAVVTLLAADADLGSAGSEQEKSATNVILTTLRATYEAAGTWKKSTLVAVGQLASTTGFGLEVRAGSRRLLDVATSQTEGVSRVFPIVVSGRRVGTATLQFPTSGLSRAEANLRRGIGTAVLTASALAALVALIAAVVTSRGLVTPVRQLTLATRRLGAGDLSIRVGKVRAPTEFAELAGAFDAMASHLEKQHALRRAIVTDLAHELRTPLAVLQAELEALTAGVEELTPAAVVSLSDEVRRLSRLVEDLEVLAAAEAAGLSLRREQVDLADVARRATTRWANRLSDEGIQLTTSLVPTVIMADPGRVEQVIFNLLANAARFTPRGGTVSVSVRPEGDSGLVVVSDTGIGIAVEDQGQVFERFFRGQNARGTSGSGIGLAVVAELVAAHGGEVSLDSSAEAGTTITIELPSA
ncbi:MAG: HAMP domain-containing sensor histidine kinase [Acidimicrobiales bacterium]